MAAGHDGVEQIAHAEAQTALDGQAEVALKPFERRFALLVAGNVALKCWCERRARVEQLSHPAPVVADEIARLRPLDVLLREGMDRHIPLRRVRVGQRQSERQQQRGGGCPQMIQNG